MASSRPPRRGIDPGVILLLGGRSEIGLEVAQRLAPGRAVVLAARRAEDLDTETARLLDAGATSVDCVEFDATDTACHGALIERIAALHGPIGVAVVAFGILGDQARAERDPTHAREIVQVDFVSQVSVLTSLATVLRAQHGGHLVVFSSVAGIRVRRANYVYGSAKAGLDGFAGGLADALTGSGVHLLLMRPGFVIGRMTAGMEPAPWSSTPTQVADAVVAGLTRRRRVVWVPPVLRWAYAAARWVPQSIWRRLPR